MSSPDLGPIGKPKYTVAPPSINFFLDNAEYALRAQDLGKPLPIYPEYTLPPAPPRPERYIPRHKRGIGERALATALMPVSFIPKRNRKS